MVWGTGTPTRAQGRWSGVRGPPPGHRAQGRWSGEAGVVSVGGHTGGLRPLPAAPQQGVGSQERLVSEICEWEGWGEGERDRGGGHTC